MAEPGVRNTLTVLRESPSGLHLDGGEDGAILLPGREIPPTIQIGDPLDVFVYRDSEDRLIATTAAPLAMVGEFAALDVVDYHPGTGAFLYWGLAKDLLLPLKEQKGHVKKGDRVLVRIFLDLRSRRIVATMRLDRFLGLTPPRWYEGDEVPLMAVEETPLGCKVIVDGTHLGMLYHSDLTETLEPGQLLQGWVRAVRPDGKLDLSPEPVGYRRVKPLAEEILSILELGGGYSPYDDQSSPEEIREIFQTSKKAFKQALGSLYRERRIRFEKPGIRLNPHNPPRQNTRPPSR